MPVDPATALAVPWKGLLTAGNTAVDLVRRSTWFAEQWRTLTLKLGVGHDVVFVGPKGVGKTMLFDGLCGAAAQAGYTIPEASLRAESAVKTLDRVLAITVVPGDEVHARSVALRESIVTNKDLQTLVLVVCGGLAKVRDEVLLRRLLADGVTLPALRELQHREEIAELERVGEVVKVAQRTKPFRLVVAVNKADLWWPEMESIYQRYSLSGNGPFAGRLRDLQAHVGRQNLEVQTVPAVAWTEDYIWGTEQIPVALRNEVDRRLVQQAFLRALS